jgi:hypothetical protein
LCESVATPVEPVPQPDIPGSHYSRSSSVIAGYAKAH